MSAKKVIIYQDASGNEPFSKWLKSLKDPVTRRCILKRLYRVENGNYGDYKNLGDGVSELRFFFGAGYRVYFGEDGETIVVLLCGGDKDSSRRILQKQNLIGRNIKKMANYRSLEDISAEYFSEHPEEINDFLLEIFNDYAGDGDSAALLSALRVIAHVKGISTMAKEIGMTRQGLQKALSSKGNPRLDNINAIMRAMGYQLMPQPLAEPV